MGGYLSAIKKSVGVTAVLRDKPENILDRITFFDIDSKLIEKDLTAREKRLYLKEIKKDITYYRKSYERANFRVDIVDLDPKEAAHRVKQRVEAWRKLQAST